MQRSRKGDAAGVAASLGDFVLNAEVPLSLGWGRNRTAYHGLHIVRKVFLKFYHARGPDKWTLARLAVVSPDKGGLCMDLPRYVSQRAGNLLRSIRPVDPTRISMWTCLLDTAFKEVVGFEEAFLGGRITLELWESARSRLHEACGHSPHPKQVATLASAQLDGNDSKEAMMKSVWGQIDFTRCGASALAAVYPTR